MCLLLFTRAAEADDNGGLNSTIKWQAVIIELTVPACDWLPGIFNWTILQQSINQMGIAAAHQQISCFLVILICWASDDAAILCVKYRQHQKFAVPITLETRVRLYLTNVTSSHNTTQAYRLIIDQPFLLFFIYCTLCLPQILFSFCSSSYKLLLMLWIWLQDIADCKLHAYIESGTFSPI